jgi:hypothetical protein
MSSGKKTKHIKAKFFFIKDRVDDGEIKVIDCPTEELWADVMTKPLQGTAFRVMHAELMNCDINYEEPPEEDELGSSPALKSVSWKKDITSYSNAPQECVGQNENLLRGWETDRQSGRRYPRGVQNLGVARLRQPTWQVGSTSKGRIRQ